MTHRTIACIFALSLPSLFACSSATSVDEAADPSEACGVDCGPRGGSAGASNMPGVAGFPSKAAGAGASQASKGGSAGSAGAPKASSGGSAGVAGAPKASSGGSAGVAGAPKASSGGGAGVAGAPKASSGGGAGVSQGAAGAASGGGPTPLGPGQARVIGYFAAWSVYGRDYHVSQLPAAQLTHINYAFANVSASGECELGDPYADTDKAYPGDGWEPGQRRGSFHQLELLKQQHPHLRTMISVGGWTWSGRFSDVAATDAGRKKFAASCAAFVEQWGFDGVDVDWEYPVEGGLDTNTTRPEDGHNYTLLLAELRAALDAKGAALGRPLELSIAAPAGPSILKHLELAQLSKSTDFINLMAYDFQGGWSARTGFNAPLYAAADDPSPPSERDTMNIDAAVKAYLAGGVPPGELVVGVPFYGRGWSGVKASSDGLFQQFGGVPQGSFEAGVFDWKDLAANYIPKSTRRFHDGSKVPWLFDAKSGVMISYDDPESMGLKADYIKQKGLGGAMIWELSGDDDQHQLLTALTKVLRP